jgi:hypothetical protein
MVADSHDTDLVSDLQGVVLLVKNNISLLLTVGSDKSVHLSNLDVVEVLAGLLDSGLGGLLVNDEDEGVEIFDGLDGGLSAEWVLHDGVLVSSWLNLGSSLHGQWLPGKAESLGESESNLGPNLLFVLSVGTLLHGSSGSLCFRLNDTDCETLQLCVLTICLLII